MCAFKVLDIFLTFILHDSRSRLTKQIYMIKHFEIDMGKRFVNFHCRTIISLCKEFTVLIFKYDISEYRNAIKMVFSAPFVLQ